MASMAGTHKGKAAVRMDSVLGGPPSQAQVGTTELKSKVSITSGTFFSESLGERDALPPGAMLPVSPSPTSTRPTTSALTPPRSAPKDLSPSLPADSPRRLQASDGRSGSVVIWGDGWERKGNDRQSGQTGNISVMAPAVQPILEFEEDQETGGGTKENRGPKFAAPQVDRELDGKKMLFACGGFGEIALLLEGGELVVSGGEPQEWGGDAVQFPLRQVVSGFQHTVLLSREGELFSMGTNTFGQLGFTGRGVEEVPRLIPAFSNRQVAAVACGQYHTVCVTDGGEVFAWGRGVEGQLGLGHSSSVPVPRYVKALSGHFVDAIAAGWNISCAVTAMGVLMVWGDNSVGQLGLGKGVGRQCAPVCVQLPPSSKANPEPLAAGVDAGWGHTVAVSLDGAAFAWGFGGRGQLGHGDREARWNPVLIQGLEGVEVKRVCCGAHFTVALTATGEVYVWGSGAHHRLGLGDDADRLEPTLSPLQGKEVTQIAVCETKVLAFAPIKLLAISPNSGPLEGGTRLRITGDGFFEAPRVKGSLDFSRFLIENGRDGAGEVRLARATYDAETGEVLMETPRVNAPATCTLELSFDNGETYTASGLTLTFYEKPTLSSISPAFRVTRGNIPLSIYGEGLEEATEHTYVRVTREAAGEAEEEAAFDRPTDVLLKASFDVATRSLQFNSPPMPPGTAQVRVALNGQQYSDDVLRITYFDPPKLLEVVPDCAPIQGGKVTISVENLLDSLLGRIRGGALGDEGIVLTATSVDTEAGKADLEIPADVPVGPATLEISVDGGQNWTEDAGLSLYLYPELDPKVDLAYANRAGGSVNVLKHESLFPARGLTVTVGNATVPAKFDMARGGVSFSVPPFDESMPRAPPPPSEDGEEPSEDLAFVPVLFSPDGQSSFAAGTLCYLAQFTFDALKPPKSGKGAAPTAITITGSGFTDTGSLVVRFEQDEAEPLYEEGTFASETSVTVTSPEGLTAGSCRLGLSLDGRSGIFEECGTAFTVL